MYFVKYTLALIVLKILRDSSAAGPCFPLAKGFANSKPSSREDDKQYVFFLLAEEQLTWDRPIDSYINQEQHENDQQYTPFQ